ncbi:MAG: nucleotidyl transferase AbiEii/AbiGii toxin family protein [Pseudomonadales bacterium]|jgi:hypothetical protein|nr:nucleotidyl transferase AbiEii/AbiGii toxin family protein [Pseudomonadales bacterium]MDP7596385.1 nucleotidyl transferase AbiEii/AbiGii toxin family protein [Pseudomonadales bacterium]HJN51047.1 nucleotidyl transferase AbiEii/AbiGii toxin family protein [Pseudomonadales bacterium]|tara:strand:+ start:102 stop:725 length:624 start_codon:yes stop_codon:yes gene_type:complete
MHPKVLSKNAWKTVRQLVADGLVNSWTLAGGTGLALQLGHRYSDDLDFFREDTFDVERLIGELARIGQVRIQSRTQDTLHVFLDDLRVSFLTAQAPLLFPGIGYRGLMLADSRDIAVMKMIAIGGRGSRKDFIDLCFILDSGSSIESIFGLIGQRFANVDYNEYHLQKSLVWFEDAEVEPMPAMIRELPWTSVKTKIIEAVQGLSGS